jgi:hypothetical protein
MITTLLIIHGLMAVALLGGANPSNAECLVAGRQEDRDVLQRHSRCLWHLVLQRDHRSVPDHGQSRGRTLPRVPRGNSCGTARLPLASAGRFV